MVLLSFPRKPLDETMLCTLHTALWAFFGSVFRQILHLNFTVTVIADNIPQETFIGLVNVAVLREQTLFASEATNDHPVWAFLIHMAVDRFGRDETFAA